MDPNDQNQNPMGPQDNPAPPPIQTPDAGQTPPPAAPPVEPPAEPIVGQTEEELPPPPPVTQEPSMGSPDEGENSTGGQPQV